MFLCLALIIQKSTKRCRACLQNLKGNHSYVGTVAFRCLPAATLWVDHSKRSLR